MPIDLDFPVPSEKNPLHGHLFEGNPVGEGTTRRGTDTPVHRPETPVGSTQLEEGPETP